MKTKEFTRRKLLNLSAYLLLIAAAVLVILTLLMQIPSIQKWYEQFQFTLVEFERAVASIPYRWLIPFVIELLFLVKAWIPVIPVSAIGVISGMVFSVPVAFVLNLGGVVILMSARYLAGMHIGPSNIQKVLRVTLPCVRFWRPKERSARCSCLFFGLCRAFQSIRLASFMALWNIRTGNIF